ncbi:MAG: signal peptide peptidase SppA [Bacteroidota bacterium]
MKEFFKFFGASALGQLVTGVILVFVFAAIFTGMLMNGLKQLSTEEKNFEVKDNSILHLKFDREINDQARNADLFDFGGSKMSGMNSIMKDIQRAASDEKIKGIFLDLTTVSAGMATLEEIRSTLAEFKKTGKFIYAYAEYYTHKSYFLASVADKIFLYPEGIVQHTGLTAEVMFLKGLIDKLELDVTIIRGSNNKFKSAVEPLMLEQMSEANRLQTSTYVNALWNHMMGKISESRKIDQSQLKWLADSLILQDAALALQYKFIDQIAYRDEVMEDLKKKAGTEKDKELALVTLKNYHDDSRLPVKDPFAKEEETEETDRDNIAVIYALGQIIDGKGDKSSIGSLDLAAEIKKAREDSTVKAIVMRVNSPGGSALASDVIWREVTLAKKSKPFIISMGDVAASGGYYISCNADRIFAQPNTITGSIGVFGVLPNMERMYKNKLGITYDRVKTNPYSDLGSVSRPMSEFEFKIIQKGVDDIYSGFINKVATGRGLTPEQVDSIGQGRVWSGMDALNIGLVDELGGLTDAIQYAAGQANLPSFNIKEYPTVKNPFEEFMAELNNEASISVLMNYFGLPENMLNYIRETQMMLKQKGNQARMMFHLEIY